MDYAGRRNESLSRMAQQGHDAYYVTDKHNVRYLCGFTGEDSTLLVTPDRTSLLTDSRYVEQAEQEALVDSVVCRKGSMIEALGVLCTELGVGRLAVASRNISHADYALLDGATPDAELVGCEDGVLEEMRLCKDGDEIAAIRAALALSERTLGRFLPHIQPGRTEKWLAARFEFEMRAGGAEAASFETIVAVDANASKPHAVPGKTAPGPQSCVLLDWGVRLDGYCAGT